MSRRERVQGCGDWGIGFPVSHLSSLLPRLSSFFFSPQLTFSRLFSPLLTSTHFFSPLLTSPHLFSSHLSSSYFFSPSLLLFFLPLSACSLSSREKIPLTFDIHDYIRFVCGLFFECLLADEHLADWLLAERKHRRRPIDQTDSTSADIEPNRNITAAWIINGNVLHLLYYRRKKYNKQMCKRRRKNIMAVWSMLQLFLLQNR